MPETMTGCTFVGCSPSLYYPFPIRHSRQQYALTHSPALHYPSHTPHSRQQYVFTHILALHYPSHTSLSPAMRLHTPPCLTLSFPIRHSRQQYAFTHCPALHYHFPIRHSRQQYAFTHCPALHYYWCPVKLFRGALSIVNRLNYCELQTYFIINTPVYTNTAGAAQNKHKLILRRDTAGHTVIAYRHKKSLPPEGERRIVRNPLIQITL